MGESTHRSQLDAEHLGRIVRWPSPAGKWEERCLEATWDYLQPLAAIETTLTVRLQGQKRAKRQPVLVHIAAVPLQLYAPDTKEQTKAVWCVCVTVEQAAQEPWYLLTD